MSFEVSPTLFLPRVVTSPLYKSLTCILGLQDSEVKGPEVTGVT